MSMTAYKTRTVTAESLSKTVAAMFHKVGMPPADADFMGQCLVDADLRGVHSHGTRYTVTYIRNLQKGAWNPTPNIRVERDRHATAVIDADRSAGHLSSRRAMQLAIEKGEKIPLGWAVDEHGNPTEDPAAALRGTLLPVGGPKGYGMSVVLDILSGVLSGATFGKGLGGPGGGHFFQATDIEAFVPLDEFKQRMGELVDQIKSSQLAPGSTGIFLPGEIEHNNKTERQKSGIPMTAVVMDELEKLAQEVGVGEKLKDV